MLNDYEEIAKVCAAIVLMLLSLYFSLFFITYYAAAGLGVFSLCGLWPTTLFGAICSKILRQREEYSPLSQGVKSWNDNKFPTDPKMQRIMDELAKTKPLPTPRT